MIYIYDANAEDLTNIGLCGALLPTSCTFEEVGNGMSEITLMHPRDKYGKYKYIGVDRILSVDVPVRTFPEIENGEFVTSVEHWHVKETASKADRGLWKKSADGKKITTVPGGAEVIVTEIPGGKITRYKVIYGKYTGWIESKALEYDSSEIISGDNGGIEKVAPSWAWKPQLFRIYSVDITDSGDITVNARHISYDLLYNITSYNVPGAYTLQDALDGVLDNCITTHDFTAKTNIAGSHVGALYADNDPIAAMLDPDNGLCKKWNAELIRDNFEIVLLDSAGLDRNVYIEYAKNLSGVSMSSDMSGVCTRIRPIGIAKDGSKLYLTTPDGCIDSEIRGNYAFDRIMTLDVNEAAVSDDMTIDRARQIMTEKALEQFANGIDMPDVSISVEFEQLGTDERYKQFAELDKVFLYDMVHVYHKWLGVDTVAQVVRVSYDCLAHRLLAIELGTLKALTSTVSGFQISGGVSGSKLVYGSVTGAQLGGDIISARHIQTESIYTDALQAGAVTAEKIAAGAITADKIRAGAVTADKIDTDSLTTKFADIADALIKSADIDFAQIKQADIGTGIVGSLIAHDAITDRYFIDKLQVVSAQIASAVIGDLVVKAADGLYYRLSVGAGGNVTAEETTLSEGEITAGVTADGRGSIVETDLTVDDLAATNFKALNALIDKLTAARIDAETLISRDAFVDALTASKIYGKGGTLYIKAMEAATDVVGDIPQYIEVKPDGTYYKDENRQSTLKITSGAVSIGTVAGESEGFSQLTSNFVQFGNYQIRKSADGGIVFKIKED